MPTRTDEMDFREINSLWTTESEITFTITLCLGVIDGNSELATQVYLLQNLSVWASAR